MISITPSQKVGIEMPKRPPSMLTLSTTVCGRTPEMVPTAMPTGTATIMDATASSSVAGNRDRIS